MNKDKMELEEAINNLKKLIKLRKNKCNEIKFDTCICGTKDLEIVLQELEKLNTDNQWLKDYLSEQGMISDYLKFRKRNV